MPELESNKEHERKNNIDWIATPGLKPVVDEFKTLYERMYSSSADKQFKKKPLMICGDTGVGKSLFVEIFKKKFVKDYTNKITTINIATFSKDLIESEIFGYVEGAFTGAKEKVEMAL